MTAFSDNFPFDPPAESDVSAAKPEPVVHAAPGQLEESSPFGSAQSTEAFADVELEPAPAAPEVADAAKPSIFGEGFPFDAPRVFDDPPAPPPAAIEAASAPAAIAASVVVPEPAPASIFTDENALPHASVIPVTAPEPLNFPERRKSPRQTMLAKAMLRPDAGGPARAVELRNLSLLGVRFRCGESIRVGERFHIKLEVGPLKWATRLRVINCVRDETGSGHYIGCAFIGNELTRAYATAA